MQKKRRMPREKKEVAVKYEVEPGWLRITFITGKKALAVFTFDNPEGFLSLFGDMLDAAAQAWPDHWLMKEYNSFDPDLKRYH